MVCGVGFDCAHVTAMDYLLMGDGTRRCDRYSLDGKSPLTLQRRCVRRYSAANLFCEKLEGFISLSSPQFCNSWMARDAVSLLMLHLSASSRVDRAKEPLFLPLYRRRASTNTARATGPKERYPGLSITECGKEQNGELSFLERPVLLCEAIPCLHNFDMGDNMRYKFHLFA